MLVRGWCPQRAVTFRRRYAHTAPVDVLAIDVLVAKEHLLSEDRVEVRQVALDPGLVLATDEGLVRIGGHDSLLAIRR